MTERSTSAVRLSREQLDLPFDQHQRHRLVADVIERLREGPDPLRILYVGGGEASILGFLPGDRVTVLDGPESREAPGFVRGDPTVLPFEDESFDYVASVDVYEHVEPADREGYLSELRRVARRGVLLAAPFDSDVVRAAERVANECHRSVNLAENVWLKEHAEKGLPRLDATREFFEGHGDGVSAIPNGYILHWLAMTCLAYYRPTLEGELSGLLDQANAFYNEFIYEQDNVEPCYRHLLVCLKGSASTDLDVPRSSNPERASQGSALFSTLSVMLPMSMRLVQKEGALARKDAQVGDLSRRLAERVVSENMQRAQAERQMSRLQRDHDELRRQRDRLQQQLTQVTGSRTWRMLSAVRKLGFGARNPGSG